MKRNFIKATAAVMSALILSLTCSNIVYAASGSAPDWIKKLDGVTVGPKAIEKSAAELNAMVMDMSELSQDLSFRAIGKFKHSGVAAHPSDKGMKRIADIIYRNLTKAL